LQIKQLTGAAYAKLGLYCAFVNDIEHLSIKRINMQTSNFEICGLSGKAVVKFGSRNYFIHAEDWGNGALRLVVKKGGGAHRPPFLIGAGAVIKPHISEQKIVYESGASRFIFLKKGGWEWLHQGRAMLKSADDFYVSFKGLRTFAPPLNLSESSAEISFHLNPDEPVYGGGETFGYLNKRRQKLHLRIMDPCGLATTGYSYKHIPLFWSPSGWGIFACTSYPVMADIGGTSFISFNLKIEEPVLDLFLLPGSPGEIIKKYWQLTGEPPLPPEWGLGVWWSRCMYKNAEEVREVVTGLKRHKIKGSVISLDPLWLKNRKSWKWDACDFEWNDDDFGRMEDFANWLHGEGYKLCLWENPHIWLGGDSLKKFKPYLLKDKSGGASKSEPPLCGMGIIKSMSRVGVWDLTSTSARQKRKQLIAELIRRGADTFKADYGDGVPGDIHNIYAFDYLQNTWEAIAEIRGEAETIIWGRPGWSGCQRFPGCWAGDSQSTFYSMASTLAGCLSLAASGVPWWSSDIGGFHHYTGRPPSAELYLRWAEWGLLSPLARFHGTTPREPWHFGKGAIAIIRDLINLRYRLIPSLIEDFSDLKRRGLPLARPLVMEYPGDRNVWDLAGEYMLGSSFLIAPILEENASSKKVYIPDGEWRRCKSGAKIFSGPAWVECRAEPGDPIIFKRSGLFRDKTKRSHF